MTTKQSQPRSKSEQRAVGEIALDWWRETISDQEKDKPRDRSARAQLRRCADPTEVFFCPAFHKLLHTLHAEGMHNRDTVAVIAGVLSHVEDKRELIANRNKRFGEQMASGKDGSDKSAVVSGLRFRRLLKCKTRDELYLPLIRVIRLMGGQVNVAELSEDIFYWGPNVQRKWACDYWDEHAPEKES